MDIERTMQFILDHQAAHAVAIAQHDEDIRRIMGVLDRIVTVQEESQRQMIEDRRRWEQAAEELRASSDRMQAAVRETQDAIKALSARVDAVIDVADDLIRRQPPTA